MAMEFGVLGSGSCGNAAVVAWAGRGVLIDLGLGARSLSKRLDKLGLCWSKLAAAVLTHIHGDHWTESALCYLSKAGLPIFCHGTHAVWLRRHSEAFLDLEQQGLVHFYEIGVSWTPTPGLRCLPLALAHDGGITCGFRFSADDELGPTLAYLADLGGWDEALVQELAEVDVLALEFNHDVAMQHASGRHPRLIQRVLGAEGHLSNEQAAGLVRALLALTGPGKLRQVVQLHLSRQCNTPQLALQSLRRVLGWEVKVHTARQDQAGPWLQVKTPTLKEGMAESPQALMQAWLPGW